MNAKYNWKITITPTEPEAGKLWAPYRVDVEKNGWVNRWDVQSLGEVVNVISELVERVPRGERAISD